MRVRERGTPVVQGIVRRAFAAAVACATFASVTQAQAAQPTPTSFPPAAPAQGVPPAANLNPSAVPGSEITVTLITFSQAHEVFERFGHNALWFHDATTGQDSAYHWGLFSFSEPGFLRRFLTGDTKYWMGSVNPSDLIEYERRNSRPITLQRLNLTPAQALALRDYVRWNAKDENKYYRYDYFGDNCSTRLRDALDKALGGAIRKATDTGPTSLTYRRESVRLTDGDKPAQAGIDIALGRPADVPLTPWQSFFIPMRLRDALRTITVDGANGTKVPLVAEEHMVPLPAGATPVVELPESPRLAVRYGVLGVVLAAIIVGLRIMALSRRSASWSLALLGAAWSLLCGLLGVILLGAWFFTRHIYWAQNENVLLLTPLSLLLVVLLPAAMLSGKATRAARMVGILVALMGVVALVLALIPGGEENRAVVALLLPVHVALAWALALPAVNVGNPSRAALYRGGRR